MFGFIKNFLYNSLYTEAVGNDGTPAAASTDKSRSTTTTEQSRETFYIGDALELDLETEAEVKGHQHDENESYRAEVAYVDPRPTHDDRKPDDVDSFHDDPESFYRMETPIEAKQVSLLSEAEARESLDNILKYGYRRANAMRVPKRAQRAQASAGLGGVAMTEVLPGNRAEGVKDNPRKRFPILCLHAKLQPVILGEYFHSEQDKQISQFLASRVDDSGVENWRMVASPLDGERIAG
ncbi:hypothetical protein B0H67DRAFT_640749 [Lasiosphaeris hirsuta]|uniref:Uncharacterized protein n=1 Tax=Lasiosphaeris hirsuta TaxID=260670 RepID=A0AA40AY75_9PEZI|nr:hypothetical protein B0H67DRAFT_640749 [Lasiosphaeris hirsuta]